MHRIPQLRIIIESEPQSGVWNMAVDEALLETAIYAEVATLRWYQWNKPTVSLGYFQKSDDLFADPVLATVPAVRRLSGGGAILHDNELTYSISIPAAQQLVDQPHELYGIVHESIVAGLRVIGFPVACRGESRKRSDEPLLCFQRQDSYDIVLSDFKVLGSAQRRRKGAILQHGSLIRKSSELAKAIPGLTDLCSTELPHDLAQILAECLAKSVAGTWERGELTDAEIETTRRLCQQVGTNIRCR